MMARGGKATSNDGKTLPRKDLLAALETVAPAVAAKSPLEALMCVWFNGDTLMAFNDVIGITVPFKSPFKGGMNGALLTGFLSHSGADTVSFEEVEGEDGALMRMKAAGAKLEAGLLPLSASVWDQPEVTGKPTRTIGNDFLVMLETVMLSAGRDTSVQDQLGVTFIPDKDDLYAYTTDSASITEVRGKLPSGYKLKRVCIPSDFCELVRKLCKKGGKLFVSESEVNAINDDGVRIFGRMINVNKPYKFFDTMDDTLAKPCFQKVPDQFPNAIERALVLLAGLPGETLEMEVKNGELILYTKSGLGELDDRMDFGKHPNIRVNVDPAIIKRVLPVSNPDEDADKKKKDDPMKMMLTDKAAVFQIGTFTYLASTRLV